MGARPFDGFLGGFAGQAMASLNRRAEAEAIDLLAPLPNARVLVVGFGPGVGVELLARRLPAGHIIGVDPSRTMMRQAVRRNRSLIAAGKVELAAALAEAVPAASGTFDGVLAVNTLQMCEPFAPTARELARVMKPGAKLASLTHAWAIEKHAPTIDAWIEMAERALGEVGFKSSEHFRGKSEKGTIVALLASR